MQLRSASVVPALRLVGQIRAHAVGGREPRTLADQDRRAVGAERCRNGVADRNASVAHDDQRGDPPAFGAQLFNHARENRPRMRLHRARRQPVRDHEHDVVAAGMRRQCRFGIGGKAAAEVRPHQIIRQRAGRTRHNKNRIAQAGKLGGQPLFIERFMHRVARAAVRQPEVEQRPGCEGSAGTRKPDARRRQSPEPVPQCVARRSIGRRALRWRGIGHDIRPATRPGAEPGRRPAGCVRLYRSSPRAPARPRIPAPDGGRTSRAWRAHRGMTCSGSPA